MERPSMGNHGDDEEEEEEDDGSEGGGSGAGGGGGGGAAPDMPKEAKVTLWLKDGGLGAFVADVLELGYDDLEVIADLEDTEVRMCNASSGRPPIIPS